MSATGLLGHFVQKHSFSTSWTCGFVGTQTTDKLICLVLYGHGCKLFFIFFFCSSYSIIWQLDQSQAGEGLGLKQNQFLYPSFALAAQAVVLVQRNYQKCIAASRGRQPALQLAMHDQETAALASPSATAELTTTREDHTIQDML